MRIVGCFLEHDEKFLILYRHSDKPDGDTWGLPGGKVERGETDRGAVAREVGEETGYKPEEEELEHLGDFDFVSSRGEPYTYGTYRVRLEDPHAVILEEGAHTNYRWVTGEECYAIGNLIMDFPNLLELTGYAKPPAE